jgi:hypothetical protein
MTALFIILVVIAAVVLLVVVRRRNGSVDVPEPQDTASISTPGGASVFSNVAVPHEALLASDEGIQKAIERMPAEWTGGRNISDYRIEFVEPQAWNQDGSPALIAGGIQTAGTVKNIRGDGSEMIIVVPHQEAVAWRFLDYLTGTIWSESEHCGEYRACIQLNDPEIFWKWARLGADDTHPHRP